MVGAAEAHRNLPRVDAGIALAEALGVSVTELFAESTLPVDVVTGQPVAEGAAVRVGRVGAREVSAPLSGSPLRLNSVDGIVANGALVPIADQRAGLVVAGCEPTLELLESILRRSGASSLAVMTSSAGAIEALRGGRVHAAVVHGRALRRADEFPEIVRLRLASWEVGIADAPDAPAGWLEEALSGRGPVVQREAGADVQQTFEGAVTGEVSAVPGPRVGSHRESAVCALYSGIPAVTIEPAARTVGAQFASLGSDDTELWIDARWAEHRVVTEALDVLLGREFQTNLKQIGGYDLSRFGTTVA